MAHEGGMGHILCDGKEEDYHLGGLVMELEVCPHPNCDACFPMHPLHNLAHQDIIHCLIKVHSCAVCRACYVTEGAFFHHVTRGHGGPLSFEIDLNEKHGPEYSLRVPYSF